MQYPNNFSLHTTQAPSNGDLGPLGLLPGEGRNPGVWQGTGFNTIWRPSSSAQRDNILELNPTSETLTFTRIPGGIPNRGMVQADVILAGVTYQQVISDVNMNEGIHIEPGMWIFVPDTLNPAEQKTIVRMASIPHGTTLQAQGLSFGPSNSSPVIEAVDITPFPIGNPGQRIHFPDETNLSVASAFRIPSVANPPNISQDMVNNPNVFLSNFLSGIDITTSTVLSISTDAAKSGLRTPIGGGTDNIAFLVGASNLPNANAVQVDAIFWIIEGNLKTSQEPMTWLLYSQTVNLNFNGLTWPHVSVAVLTKQ